MTCFAHKSYKESGIDWCPRIPEHWESTKTKYVTGFTTGWTPPTGDDEAYNGTNCWANISDLGPKVLENTAKTISDSAAAASRIKPSPQGSLMFSFKLSIGQVSLAGREMYTNEAIATFPGSDKLAIPFAYYAFPVFLVQNASENIYGAKLLNQELMRAARFPLPSLVEQLAIASFLDREIANIDTLIAEQQRLIELLQEKRQAVISHAVTKGLNPNAPMKDSGVEWLGEVPEHWDVARYKRFCELQRGHDLTGDERVEGPYPVVTSGGINGFHSEFIAKAPGVVTGRYGSTGTVFYVDDDYWPHNTSLYIKDFHGNSPRFSWYLLQAIDLKSLSAKSAVPGIDRNDVHALFVAFPHLQEQIEIASYLDNYSEKQSLLIEQAEISVRLLQERRSALITAAVTGQIDVRGLVEAGGSEQ